MLATCCFALLALVAVDAMEENPHVEWAGDWNPSRRVSATDTISIMFVFRRSEEQLKQLEAVCVFAPCFMHTVFV